MIKYGSICSGIESASVAWEPLGMKPAWFSEIEAFPSAVLAHHWPQIANLGDMCELPAMVAAGLIEAPSVLVGGTPCQAFSVAGLRKGLDDERGQLTLKYVELLNEIDKQRPIDDECVAVWENVPGVLSSKDNAFGCFLGALAGEDEQLQPAGKKWTNAGCVFGPQRTIAWRILDAQYFGVAQRRRRVFVVASARKGFDPRSVLFESEGVRRDIAPSRETREEITESITSELNQGNEIAHCLQTTCNDYSRADGFNMVVHPINDKATRHAGKTVFEVRPINTMTVQGRPSDDKNPRMGSGIGKPDQPQNTLSTAHHHGVFDSRTMVVRRLTPVECERLQGFPDDHTRVPYRKKPIENCPDGPRYKAIGNSKAVPVIQWIGKRLVKEINKNAN